MKSIKDKVFVISLKNETISLLNNEEKVNFDEFFCKSVYVCGITASNIV